MLPSPLLAGLLTQTDPSTVDPTLLGLLAGAPGPTLTPTQQPIAVPLGPTQSAPVVPMQVPPGIPAPPPSGFQNLLAGLFPDQTGMGGLLAPDAMTQARNNALMAFGTSLLGAAGPHIRMQSPTFLQAVAGGLEAGRNAMQQGVQQDVQSQLSLPAIKMQLASIAARQQLQSQFPQLAGLAPEQLAQRLPALAMQYLQAGDPTTASALVSIGHTLGLGANRFQAVQAGDAVYRFDPATGQAEKIITRGMDPDTLAMRKAQLADAQLSLKTRQEQFDETQDRMAGQQFRSANQNLYNVAQTIAMARASLAQLSAKNPAALSSAILAMVNVADPKAQLRSQLVNYMSHIDKSWHGTFDQAIARITSGTMPMAQLQEMKNLVEQHAQTYEAMYQQRRSEAIKNRPGAALWIPSTDAVFNTPNIGPNDTLGPSGAASGPQSSILWQY